MPRALPAHVLSGRRWLVVPVASALTMGVLIGQAEVAHAYTYFPSVPTGYKVVKATRHSFTVTLRKSTHATRYRIIASTVRSDVYVDNVNKPSRYRHTVTARRPRLTVSGLPYTTRTIYYRVGSINKNRIHWAPTFPEAYLRPSAPTHLAARMSGGLHLTWSHGAAAGFTIQQATNPSFTRSARTYRIRVNAGSFAPYGTRSKGSYYFRVRAANGYSHSAWTPAVHVRSASGHVALRVATYNTLTSSWDGTKESGNVIARWSQRRPGIIANLNDLDAAVISVQEAGVYVDSYHKTRQIDSIAAGVRSRYRFANPGIRYARDGWAESFVLYQPTIVKPVGSPGYFQLDSTHVSSYQVFRELRTGARFLFVATHLVANRGRSYDKQRRVEAASLVSRSRSFAKRHRVASIVLAGDFNTYPGRRGVADTPGKVLVHARFGDALRMAQSVHNSSYNSVNEYKRIPPRNGGCVDHVFTSPAVGIASWDQLLHLSGGKFVGIMPSDHNPVYSTIELPY